MIQLQQAPVKTQAIDSGSLVTQPWSRWYNDLVAWITKRSSIAAVLASQKNTVTISNSSAETTLLTAQIQPDICSDDTVILGSIRGWISSDNPTAPNLVISVKVGTTAISTVTIALAPSLVAQWFEYSFVANLRGSGRAGKIMCSASVLGALSTYHIQGSPQIADVVIDTTSKNTITISAQFSAADSSNVLIAQNGYVKIDNVA